MHINRNILKFRKLKSISQQEVADLIGEKRSTYAEWERETPPRADILVKLASALGVTVYDILAETPEQSDINLNSIAEYLVKIYNEQKKTRAEIRGFGKYDVLKDSKGDEKKFQDIMVQINNLIGLELQVNEQKGSDQADNGGNSD